MYACKARTRNVMIASGSSEILNQRNIEIFGHRFKKRRQQSADEHRPDPGFTAIAPKRGPLR
jgi:hypothetical protein